MRRLGIVVSHPFAKDAKRMGTKFRGKNSFRPDMEHPISQEELIPPDMGHAAIVLGPVTYA
jgi:hypothetical protein